MVDRVANNNLHGRPGDLASRSRRHPQRALGDVIRLAGPGQYSKTLDPKEIYDGEEKG